MGCAVHCSQAGLSGRTQTACICLFTTSTWSGWCGRNCVNHLLGSMTLSSIFHGGAEREQAVCPQAQLCRWSQCDGKHLFHLSEIQLLSSLVEDRWNKHQGSYQLWNSVIPWGFNRGIGIGCLHICWNLRGWNEYLVPLWRRRINKAITANRVLGTVVRWTECRTAEQPPRAAWGAVTLLMRIIYLFYI